jgi:hypothetical protein
MQESARVTGARAYISELGALLTERNGSGAETVVTNYGALGGDGSPFEEMARSGAGAFLLDRYRGRLEPHTPWSAQPREATMLFRGHVADGQAALDEAGYGWLEFHDNGVIPRSFPGLDVAEVHAYHLVPRGVSKTAAVRLHLERTGVPPEAAAAVGDAPSDLDIASAVGRVFIVANGRASVSEEAVAATSNAEFTRAGHGEGFAEAVDALLD